MSYLFVKQTSAVGTFTEFMRYGKENRDLPMKILARLSSFGAVLLASCSHAAQDQPRLVVVISVDQYRADYLSRFSEHYLPAQTQSGVGGFRWLQQNGATYLDAHHIQLPTATGPGHAAILTGTGPAVHGISGNSWYDRETGKVVYCVEDPLSKTVGSNASPMSPRNLKSTTVGDELKMATNGKAKVVGVAFKDRASILMAGHAADTVIWLDTNGGNWVTSDFYSPTLPQWVQDLNSQKLIGADMDKNWTPLLPDEAYSLTRVKPGQAEGQSPLFSHPAKEDWIGSSYGQEYLFRTVKLAVEHENLGQDEVPDVLAVNLSSNDYVGHDFGPNSPEAMDISVRTDRLLSDFLKYLNTHVPGGLKNVTIALTADHGVVPLVEEARDRYRLPSVRVPSASVVKAVDDVFDSRFGAGDWVSSMMDVNLYLNSDLIIEKGVTLEEAQELAAKAASTVAGIHYAVPANRILQGQVPSWDWMRILTRNYNPKNSGDVIVIASPGNYPGSGGTGHYSPWAYDSHVPLLLAGFGVKPGVYGRRAEVPMIAPTLSQILGIEYPSGNTAELLWEALDEKALGIRR